MKLSIIFCLLLVLIEKSLAQNSQTPNFIFVLTDDQYYGMMGCTGNKIVQTPNLDKIASQGILFSNAHVTSAICTPSRTSILLSEFERKHGINFNSGTSMNIEAWESTFPMVMRKAGYYTGWIGKNHVPVGEGGYDSGIMEQSFDYWYAGHGHLRFYPKEHHDIFQSAKQDTQIEIISEGVNDFLSNEQKLGGAIRFLDKRSKEKPFMLSICFNLPHGAGTSSMELRKSDDEIYRTKFRDVEIPIPRNYVAREAIKEPKLPENLLRDSDRQVGYNYVDTPETNKERLIRQYQAMVGIDRMMGQLLEKLERENIEENTVIIFTSDHGLFMGQFGLGGKALCYEQTTHVPFMIYDPRTQKKYRGIKSDALVQSIDIAPTLLDMAGIEIPASYQGKSLVNLVNGGKDEFREYLFTENLWSTQFGNPRCEAVQNKKWKYIRYYKNNTFSASKKIAAAKAIGIPVNQMLYKVHDLDIAIYRDYVESPISGEKPVYEELYKLDEDPFETTNLIDREEYATILDGLRIKWKEELLNARGNQNPRVLRYTVDSENERKARKIE